MTPSHDSLADRAARDLEWTRLTDAVLARCAGASARRRGVPLAHSHEHTEVALRETAEALRLLRDGAPLPLSDVRDVDGHLSRLQRHGSLDGAGLADVMAMLQLGTRLRRFLGSHRASTVALSEACALDPSLDRLAEDLADSIDDVGRLHDHASADLRKLRREVSDLRDRIIGRLEQLMTDQAALLQDRFYTLREGRYVLPVRSDAHEPFDGIVHTASVSGATIFVEPRAIVQLGNRLKLAEAELEREQERLYAALSSRVMEQLATVSNCAAAIDHADLRCACARLAHDTASEIPTLMNEPAIRLCNARHPLLVLDGKTVVANDIELRGGQGLIISGPNAGGKTVALKLLGLAALMVRAGLALPADDSSQCGYFDDVLTDIGDDQSTQRDLSTFSAHVQNLAAVIERAGPRSLVLLDELAGGTDPAEGSALACAIVEALCTSGTAVAVTTHYESLKALAARSDHLRNASVGFDMDKLAPTFRLLMDVPGASSALRVAERFGIPAGVVADAAARVPTQVRDFDALAMHLHAELSRLSRREIDLDDRESSLSARERNLDERAARLAEQSQRKLAAESEALMQELRAARAEVADARKQLRTQRAEPDPIKPASQLIDRVAQRVAIGGDLVPASPETNAPVDPSYAPRVGDTVYVSRLRATGTLIEAPAKGQARVSVGGMKLWVDLTELRPGAQTSSPEPAPKPTVVTEASPPLSRHSDNTVDVRGMRVDDALGLVESFVDRLYNTPQRAGFVLHGHGTGALRTAIREHLTRAIPHVQTHRSGTRDEGGEAVTVVFLT